MKLLATLALLAAACGSPMQPGETRCYSTPAGNAYVTKCKTAPLATGAAIVTGFYCTVRPDYFGVCRRTELECERVRYTDDTFAPCARQGVAACLGAECFSDRASCERYAENHEGRCAPAE